MTEQFYHHFLSYIGPKNFHTLCSDLQKNQFVVSGYRMKSVPVDRLASYIAQNELRFLHILQKVYLSKGASSCKDIHSLTYSPETALVYLATVSKMGQIIDEDSLMKSMEDTSPNAPPNSVQCNTKADAKAQKKTDEFRKKYLSTYKLLELERKTSQRLKEEIDSLEIKLADREGFLKKEIEKLTLEKTEYENEIATLNRIIAEQTEALKPPHTNLLVATNKQFESNGAVVISIDELMHFHERIYDYDEILLVENDIPFSIKHQIKKEESIMKKLHTFSTNAAMISYIEERGLK